jgi:hypothetical protein
MVLCLYFLVFGLVFVLSGILGVFVPGYIATLSYCGLSVESVKERESWFCDKFGWERSACIKHS